MDDVWELYYGLNPGSPNDSIGNLDFDGATNVEEYQGMTDPGVIDVVAPPKILDWEYSGGFLIGSFVSAPGVDYNMWVSTDLVNWGPVPFTGEAGASQTSFNFPPFQPASDRVFLEIRTVD